MLSSVLTLDMILWIEAKLGMNRKDVLLENA